MSKALIQYKGINAGILKETDEGYEFSYNEEYLADVASAPVSLTLPLTDKPYQSTVLFPFFDGLIPEGWLLDVALRNTDISELDRLGPERSTSTNPAAGSSSELPRLLRLIIHVRRWMNWPPR